MTPELPALNPQDKDVPHTLDFSKILSSDETIDSVVGVTVVPDSLAVGAANVVDGKRPRCAVQFTLGDGQVGNYIVTATIVTTTGIRLGRPVIVPVSAV